MFPKRVVSLLSFALVSVVLCGIATAQQQADRLAIAQKHLAAWRNASAPALLNDWGQLHRYQEQNAALKSPAAGEHRVVFFGDSITDFWNLPEFFPGKPYVNRGISGQTTSQMLVRFRQDVIDLKPQAVIILAGTNDIAGNTGPITLENIEANYASITELARAHNIRVLWCSVTPVHDYTEQSHDFFVTRPISDILSLNTWLKSYCAKGNCTYVDYYSSMVDTKGFLKRELSTDGLHPNEAGYRIMASLAEKAIEQVVGTASGK